MGLSLQKLANLVHNSNSEENRRMCGRAPGLKIIKMSSSKLYDPMSSTVAFKEFPRVSPIISDCERYILYSKMAGACKLALEVQAELGPTA